MEDQKLNLLIGLSGSIAVIKLQEILEKLIKSEKFNIKIVATQKSLTFFDYAIQSYIEQNKLEIFTDENEWGQWKQRGDPVLHIDLRKWAHIFVITPLSANTLAKITNGICDNLLTSIVRAWDLTLDSKQIFFRYNQQDTVQTILNKPIIVAPAMNTYMYNHPITLKQLNKLKKWNFIIMDTLEKILMCGDKGIYLQQKD
ncbi:phosphopantothenoylcysteine decarboxylase, putative [Ichthyophthirius multifiliis]|uniref:Phosphopantothenoylcysteine decarboxylase, putative n=1 Tax=Ichthyophthirius multifiliis TaxID=5932 RepID=G0QJH7_ICHMU|nr:phosphopantothenoylcysteine decarboxylase, putative [Ichthyophthirius multifiliis]EGR34628.1 phosphopantothenoylcysteine decarboxylase, putative [Ichthyophthirius multifiliis]|eukprot:XP_004039932.1 phosphopantothenoylcysteine decarboxylase, putative [Ichthyophthirius multifiliis]